MMNDSKDPYRQLRFKSACMAIKAIAAAGGDVYSAQKACVKRYGADSDEALFLEKAAISPSTTDSNGWGADIAEATGNALFEAAREASVHGLLSRVPLNTRLTGISTEPTASFVGEGDAAPLTQLALSGNTLPAKQVASSVVASKELAKLSEPAAEAVFQAEILKAIVNAIDGALLSTASASSTTPAGLYNGVTPHAATSDATADIRELVDDFQGDLSEAFFVGSPKVLASLNSDARPSVGLRGGRILNAPAIASRNAPAGTLALIDGTGVAFGDGGIEVSASSEASAEMADDASSPAQHVSFWQSGLVGIRISRNVNWATVRPGSIAVISGATW